MYYILNPRVALRSWHLVPFAYYLYHERNPKGLHADQFEILLQCDAMHDIESSPVLDDLVKMGFCKACQKGEYQLNEWQKPLICDNRLFPAMNWMITGRCNYNCLHCFNAADNARLQSEFTMEEANKLIKEARECGINAFTLTGGEPMVHPHFMDIVRGIYENHMYINELNTNGSFLTQEILDEMKEIGCYPLMKISFDGIGHHDWLRNKKGAEEDAIRAIKLCVDNGFRVKAQTNVHRLNEDCILDTAKMLDSIGVQEMRIIRTTEAPRWVQNAGDSCLTLEEYFDGALDFFRDYIKTDCSMIIDVWQFLTIFPQSKMYRPRPMECAIGEYRDSIPVCRGNRGMVAVGANGNLYPCHQMSGYYEQHHDFLGNVKQSGLHECLTHSRYLNEICTTVGELAEHNKKCGDCKWFKYCAGGCRAIGLALTGDKLGPDKAKCLFFENGYLNKIAEVMEGYTNTHPIADEDRT